MIRNKSSAVRLFEKSIALVTGLDPSYPQALGGTSVDAIGGPGGGASSSLKQAIAFIFRHCIERGDYDPGNGGNRIPDDTERLLDLAAEAKEVFCTFYDRKENRESAESALSKLDNPDLPPEEKAAVIAKIWAPETGMSDDDIVRRWRLSGVKPNPDPILPTEVVIQLNALYTLPDTGAKYADPELESKAEEAVRKPGRKIADYDHPVHLFEKDENHELINCLRELDKDLAFEKEQAVLPVEYKLPVLLSVSVTHEKLDEICGDWILSRVKALDLSNIKVIILTESAIRKIRSGLLGEDISVYSVFGKYGVHFNALKYTQLLLEKAYGIRAGFKLDTDEGVRSRDLFDVTGKTWLQTLCHELWGGTALDWRGKDVTLACNLGEYINEKDIALLGYKDSMREPDVKAPDTALHGDILFNKGAAHGQATALYNQYDSLSDHLSHTVVKGGGYGITNDGLRKAVPFTFSLVGRAEDQQFYFSGISRGIRGIFHPDLRIAHYKGAVASSEKKTAATRFLGDMYRLIIFQHLADILEVKADIDPMPGVFAGGLARAQAFFHTLYKAFRFIQAGERGNAEFLLSEGLAELEELKLKIDSGDIRRQLQRETDEWERFIAAADNVDPEKTKSVMDGFVV